MRGKIFNMKGYGAKIEIWHDEGVFSKKRDEGGWCEICQKYLYSLSDLIKHFKEHERMEGES